MNNSVQCFKADGHKSFSIYLPDRIVSMQKLEVQSARMSRCLLVALHNGELRVYNEKNLVTVHNTSAPVSGIWFGRYGREDNTLITVTKSGAVEIKMLPRTAGGGH
jgi:Bardet-Biedl syndrome 1 protein